MPDPQQDATPPIKVNLGPGATGQSPIKVNLGPGATAAAPQATDEDRPGFFTRSLVETLGGPSLSGAYEKNVLPALQSVLPKSMQGAYATELLGEVSKAGPGFVDFLASPLGGSLFAAHFVPMLAPFAAAGDVALGGWQALKAIPDTIDAVTHIGDPHKVGRAFVDIASAYMGVKGGGRVARAVREIPAGTSRGMPMARAYVDAFGRAAPPAPPQPGTELRARLDAAAPEDRPDIIREAETPTNIRSQVEQKMYRTPGLRVATNVLGPRLKQPPILDLGQHLVDEHIGRIAAEENEARRAKDWIERNVPEHEQDLTRMGFAMEGDLPQSNLSPEAQAGLEKARELNRRRDAMHIEAGVSPDALLDPETYLRHYWNFDDPNNPSGARGSKRAMRDMSLQGRKIDTLKLGMTPEAEGGYGLTPKYNKIGDVIYQRHMDAVTAIENRKLANTLRDYGLVVDPTPDNIANTGWAQAKDSPALNKAMYAGKSSGGETILREKPVLMHPDIEMAVNAIFNEPFKGPIWGAINQLRAFSKQIAVGYSLFHLNALSEVAQAHAAGAGGLEAVPRFIRALAWPADPEFRKGLRNSYVEVMRGKVAPDAPPDVRWAPELVQPWLEDGLSARSSESEGVALKAASDFLHSHYGWIGKIAGTGVDVQRVFNRALFDYYLPGQMLHAAEHLQASEMNRLGPNPAPEAVKALRREIADHINRTAGAENMQHLLITPKAQQAMGLALFAPMWTMSNLRVLAKGFETTTGARLTGRYAAGAALTYFLTSQLANYALSSWAAYKHPEDKNAGAYWDDATQQWKQGGHWTWQNVGDPVKIAGKYVRGLSDNAANIYMGQNPDGSQRYIRLAKAFREPFWWLTHPLETLGSKLSLLLQTLMIELGGTSPGTMFPDIDTRLTPEQQKEQGLAILARPVTPFIAQGLADRIARAADPNVFRAPQDTQVLGLPTRKGASYFKSVQALREAIDDGRADMAEQVRRNASLNGISRKILDAEVKSRLRRQGRTAAGPPTAPPPTPGPVKVNLGPSARP